MPILERLKNTRSANRFKQPGKGDAPGAGRGAFCRPILQLGIVAACSATNSEVASLWALTCIGSYSLAKLLGLALAAAVLERGGDYVLAIKANHVPSSRWLCNNLRDRASAASPRQAPALPAGRICPLVRYYLFSKYPAPKRLLHITRSHWVIENKLHWVSTSNSPRMPMRAKRQCAGESRHSPQARPQHPQNAPIPHLRVAKSNALAGTMPSSWKPSVMCDSPAP
jgi:hypothetical protein